MVSGKKDIFTKLLHKMNYLCLKFEKIPKIKMNYVKDKDGNCMKIFQGCAQFSITSELVEYILKFHDNNPQFNRYFKSMYAPDEAYFHTIKIFQGCAQFSITSELVEYILKFHDNNPQFNRYFKSMYAPDEAYFHTIIHNSDYVKNVRKKNIPLNPHLTDLENLTYFEYPDKVILFTQKEDYIKLKESGFLYFRKASSESNELLDYIDRIHVEEQENSYEYI